MPSSAIDARGAGHIPVDARTRRPASPAVHRTRYPNVAYISLIDSIASQCAATSALNKTAH
ncbi:hypothetical protein BURMUCF2_2980 [Burkholderia multivorans CF2]|nr:hypothetical protein BURMUCF2_2980 [Burkholderia multivorans CF2]